MSSDIPPTTITRSTVSVISLIAIAVLSVFTLAFAFLYFQANRDLEAQKVIVSALQTDISATKAETAREAAHAAELKSDLNTARSDAQSLAAKSAQLKSEIDVKEQTLAEEKAKSASSQAALEREKARSPAVPVRIEMRRSAVGRGLVAMFTNTSAKQLPLLLAMRNPTTQIVKQVSFQVAPGAKVEVGHQEGWQFASGDQVHLRSAGFEDSQYTVP